MRKAIPVFLLVVVITMAIPAIDIVGDGAVPIFPSSSAYAIDWNDCCAQGDGWCCALMRLSDWWEDFWHDEAGWDW
jgi:hypothetical protein